MQGSYVVKWEAEIDQDNEYTVVSVKTPVEKTEASSEQEA